MNYKLEAIQEVEKKEWRAKEKNSSNFPSYLHMTKEKGKAFPTFDFRTVVYDFLLFLFEHLYFFYLLLAFIFLLSFSLCGSFIVA